MKLFVDMLFVGGAVAITTGFLIAWLPLGLIVGGVLAVLVALTIDVDGAA